jgi:hypothetical protein
MATSIAAACATALLAAMPFACGTATAADLLIIKAPPKALDPAGQFWAKLDALARTVKGARPPPLVTTSPAGTPPAQAGVLGAPGTTVLFGDSPVDGGWRAGGRLQAGYWFDPQRSSGLEFSFFDLQDVSIGFAANSGGTPILARPRKDSRTFLLTSVRHRQNSYDKGNLLATITASATID